MKEQILEEKSSNVIKKKTFLQRLYKYAIKTSNGMALGLFATLIIGTIIGTLGGYIPTTFKIGDFILKDNILLMADLLKKGLMGAGIGFGVALTLKLNPMQMLAAGVAGAIGTSISPGNPLMAYLCTVFAIEITRLILKKKTPIDILIIPLLMSVIAFIIGWILKTPMEFIIRQIGDFVDNMTTVQPFLMGIIIAVVMGMILTAPISSVAVAVAISLSGVAGGAAVVGCSVQMIGFAVMTFRDKQNNIGKVISVGIGTSMLQFKNIMAKPVIWLPTIIVSAILGPLATCVFKMESSIIGSGMGTCGLVGQIGTIETMKSGLNLYLGMALLHFILPIILVFAIDWYMRKKKIIKPGDLAI